jgi:hypothetical protein
MKREPPMPHDFAHDGMESRDWRMLAACLDEDPELFFPTGTTLSASLLSLAHYSAVSAGSPA